jgi:hypothetical protein
MREFPLSQKKCSLANNGCSIVDRNGRLKNWMQNICMFDVLCCVQSVEMWDGKFVVMLESPKVPDNALSPGQEKIAAL